MKYTTLETVVLAKDLPHRRLRAGDLGTVVHVYEPHGIEVEFVTASGATEALVTLREDDVRSVGADDIVAVRQLNRSA